jgi:hypothetical protein
VIGFHISYSAKRSLVYYFGYECVYVIHNSNSGKSKDYVLCKKQSRYSISYVTEIREFFEQIAMKISERKYCQTDRFELHESSKDNNVPVA